MTFVTCPSNAWPMPRCWLAVGSCGTDHANRIRTHLVEAAPLANDSADDTLVTTPGREFTPSASRGWATDTFSDNVRPTVCSLTGTTTALAGTSAATSIGRRVVRPAQNPKAPTAATTTATVTPLPKRPLAPPPRSRREVCAVFARYQRCGTCPPRRVGASATPSRRASVADAQEGEAWRRGATLFDEAGVTERVSIPLPLSGHVDLPRRQRDEFLDSLFG